MKVNSTTSVGKKTKAKARFDETMSRCDALTLLYDSTHNDDLLRASVVLSVSALERYLKDRFLESFIPFLKMVRKAGRNWNERTKKLLKDSGVNEEFWQACAINQTKKFFAKISTKVRNRVRKMTLQDRGVIEHLYTCYGMSIIQCAVDKSDKKRLWNSIAMLIKRRHRIVHHSGYLNAGKLDEIDKAEIEKRIGHVKQLVICIEDLLVQRFKKKRRRGAGKKKGKA